MEKPLDSEPPQEVKLEDIVHALYQGAPVNLDVLRPVSSVTVVPLIPRAETGSSSLQVSSASFEQLPTDKVNEECRNGLGDHQSDFLTPHESDPLTDLTLNDIIKKRFEQNMKQDIDGSVNRLTANKKRPAESKQVPSSIMSLRKKTRKVRDCFVGSGSNTVDHSLSAKYTDVLKNDANIQAQLKKSRQGNNNEGDPTTSSSQSFHGSDRAEESLKYSLVSYNNWEYALSTSSSCKLKGATLATDDEFDEMWLLPNDICWICAKRGESIQHLLSDSSQRSRIVQLIQTHLQQTVTPEDLFFSDVCLSCIESLESIDKLVKTCNATRKTLGILSEHMCKVSLPIDSCKVAITNAESLANEPLKQHCLLNSSNQGYSDPTSAAKSSDVCEVQVNPGTGPLAFHQLLTIEDVDDFEQIKSNCTMMSLVKVPKESDVKETKHIEVLGILKNLNACPVLKKRNENKSELFVVADLSPDKRSASLVDSNYDAKEYSVDCNLPNSNGQENISALHSQDGSVKGLSVGNQPNAASRKIARQRERRRLARLNKLFKCCDCDYTTAVKEELIKHKKIHLRCKYCDKQHKSKVNLIEHERIHTKEKPFICDHCGLRYRTKQQMLQHAQRHNPETPYICEICGQGFSVKTTYTAHVLRHNPESEFLCEACGRSFKSNAALRFHRLSHRTFKCSHCDQSFSYRKLQVHKKIHTGEGYFTCSQCDKRFLSRETLKNHQLIHEGVFPFNCGVCHRSFKRITHLQAHRQRHAGDLLLGLKFYRCAICEESYDKAVDLSKHVQSHSEEERQKVKAFKCSSCDKCFPEEQELRSHEDQHENPVYSCSTCNQSFSQQEDLNEHAIDHSEDKPLICNVCQKRFGTLVDLNNHKVIHSLVKPYSCALCSKTFKTVNGLNQHKIAHSDVLRFSCSSCSLSFKRRDALKNHECTHFTERPYSCSVCARSFKAKTDCTTHVRRHRLSGIEGGSVMETMYNCQTCTLVFTMKVDLMNHLSASHPETGSSLQDGDSIISEDVNVCQG